MIDPIGLALENFDVTGRWRIRDNGAPVDPVGDLYDGTPMNGPVGLRAALLKHQDMFVLSFTERLMTYGLGRRVDSFDMPAMRKIIRDAAKDNYRFSAFVMGVVNSRAFQMSRATGPTTTVDDARGSRADSPGFSRGSEGERARWSSSRRSTCPGAPFFAASASRWRCRCSTP